MKITKQQLRRIIREERARILAEQAVSMEDLLRDIGDLSRRQPKPAFLALRDALVVTDDDAETFKMLVDMGLSADELAENFPELARHIRKLSPAELRTVADSI
jgi:hypothetical protein